jgi:hypothetical protein
LVCCWLGGEVNEKPQTARSYRTNVIDDNAVISINLKWMAQIIVLCSGLVWGYYRIETRIAKLEEGMLEANNEIRSLLAKHELEESAQLEELESKLKFYEKELNINPLSWRKRKKK